MSTTTFSPPEELQELGPRTYAALLVPFGEEIAAPNEHAVLSYRWGDAASLSLRTVAKRKESEHVWS